MADIREMILGKHIWYRCGYCDVNEGVAEALVGENHVRVLCVGADGPTMHKRVVSTDDIYLTKEDLLGANYERWQAEVKSYEDTISTVEDLVRFCFDHAVGKSEETDDIARLAARHKAKELLGIEVDEEAAAREAEIQDIIDEECR